MKSPSILTLIFSTTKDAEVSVTSMGRPQLTPKEISWYLFLLEAEKDRRATECGLEHFRGPHRKSNSECPVLWPSASDNRATASPHDAIHSSYNSAENPNFKRSVHGEGNINEFETFLLPTDAHNVKKIQSY